MCLSRKQVADCVPVIIHSSSSISWGTDFLLDSWCESGAGPLEWLHESRKQNLNSMKQLSRTGQSCFELVCIRWVHVAAVAQGAAYVPTHVPNIPIWIHVSLVLCPTQGCSMVQWRPNLLAVLATSKVPFQHSTYITEVRRWTIWKHTYLPSLCFCIGLKVLNVWASYK